MSAHCLLSAVPARNIAPSSPDACVWHAIREVFFHWRKSMRRILVLLVMLFFSTFAIAAVNINTATKEELDALPGIGPVKAQAIIDYRTKNGPFKTPEDIMKVPGIKEGEFGKLKGQISVSGASTPAAATATKEMKA